MNQGIKMIIYPVKDIARAKNVFGKFLAVEPYETSRIMSDLRSEIRT